MVLLVCCCNSYPWYAICLTPAGCMQAVDVLLVRACLIMASCACNPCSHQISVFLLHPHQLMLTGVDHGDVLDAIMALQCMRAVCRSAGAQLANSSSGQQPGSSSGSHLCQSSWRCMITAPGRHHHGNILKMACIFGSSVPSGQQQR